jgi:hypothetical protein
VKVTPQEENAVSKMVQETWLPHYIGKGHDGAGLEDLEYNNIKIINVERIENTELFEKYSQTRSKLFLKAGNLKKTFIQLQDIQVGTKMRQPRFLNHLRHGILLLWCYLHKLLFLLFALRVPFLQ